jgi:PAS domain S-box-containing protein
MRRLLGSLERSLALLNAIGDGVNALDTNGELIYANDAIARITGFPDGQTLMGASRGQLATQFFVWDEAGNSLDLGEVPGRKALTGIQVPEVILRSYTTTTGQAHWLSVRAWPVFDDAGNVEFSVTVARDITQFKQHEIRQQFLAEASKTLTESLDYEVTLANVAALAIPRIADWCAVDLVDEEGNIQRVAVEHVDPDKVALAYEFQRRYPPNLQSETGFAKVIKTGQSDYYPHISDEMVIAAARGDAERLDMLQQLKFRSALVVPLTARGRTFGGITLVTSDDQGRYLTREDVALAEELGRVAGLAVDNAKLYQQAQAERQRFEVTLRSIGDAVIATDDEGRITFINDVAQALTGWGAADAIGQPIGDVFRIINEETRLTVESPVDRVLREGVIVGLANHTLLLAKDGREVPIDDSGAPIRDSEGETRGVVLVFRDITERKALDQEREEILRLERAARLEAENADQLKLKFLAMISHELRTPLTSIKGFSTTLLADDVQWSMENYREFISIIDEEADKLTDLIEQLLDIARMQSGTLRINPEPRSPSQLVRDARPSLEQIAIRHPLVVNMVDGLPPVQVDQQRILQVLCNLVENATKYSSDQTPIQVSLFQTGDFVQVDVSDKGVGIPLEERQLVFEAFRQVERKEQAKGAGLGLAICKGLIEAHGGHIWIQDKTPGTTISFTLPLAEGKFASE